MKAKANEQGNLDGLCGIYAIVNAVDAISGRDEFDREEQAELFSELVRCEFERLENIKFVSDGIYLVGMKRLVKRAESYLEQKKVLGVKCKAGLPGTGQGKNIGHFWDEIEKLLASDVPTAVVVGYNESDGTGHWTCVAKATGKTLMLRDSCGLSQLRKGGGTLARTIPKGKRQYKWSEVFSFWRLP